jgi:hypothetical protein
MILKNGVFFLLIWVLLFGRHLFLFCTLFIANTNSHLLRLFALLLIPKFFLKKISPFYIRETKFPKLSQWFFSPIHVSPSSQYVPPRVFPISPYLYPLEFAQSFPLLNYIGESQGGGITSSHRNSYVGELPKFQDIYIWWWVNQNSSL